MSEQDTTPQTVIVEREIPHAAEKIWRALTEGELIAQWLMKTDFKEPALGQRFKLWGDWGGVECEIVNVEPHTTLSYTWDYAHEDPAYALKSVVVFTLTPTANGTHLRMEQTGFRADQKQALGGAKYGWGQHLENLEKVAAGLD